MNDNINQPTSGRDSPLLTADQAATYLTIKVSTLNKYRRNGLIRATYICSDARYHRDDLNAFIEARRSN